MRAAEDSREKPEFYDSWISRDEAVFLALHRDNEQALKAFLNEKLANEEEVEGDEFRLQIHIDFHLETFRFCVQVGFTAEQTSTLMSIIRQVFRDSLKNRLPTETSFEKLQECLHMYLRDTPPFMRQVFSASECAQVQRFACHLYKFFMMYEMSMTKFIDFNILTHEPLSYLPADEPLESGRELDDNQLRQEAALFAYLGTATSQQPAEIAAKHEPAKPQATATPLNDEKAKAAEAGLDGGRPLVVAGEGNGKGEAAETEESRDVRAAVDLRLESFKDRFEHETLKKADEDIEGYIDKHGKGKKKK